MRKLLLSACILALLFSCDDEPKEKLKGQMKIGVNASGSIDASHQFLITFNSLVGDLEFEDGVMVTANQDISLEMPRVGEQLEVYLSEVPSNCGNYSMTSSANMIATPLSSPSEPDAVYGASLIVPVDGSLGELTFSMECN